MKLLKMTQRFQNAYVSKECKRCSPPSHLAWASCKGDGRKRGVVAGILNPPRHTHLLTAPVWGPPHSQELKHLHKEQLAPESKQQEVSECTGELMSELGDSVVLFPLMACAPPKHLPFFLGNWFVLMVAQEVSSHRILLKKPSWAAFRPEERQELIIQIVAVREKVARGYMNMEPRSPNPRPL